MKKLLFILSTLTLVLGSCNDVLKEVPKDSLSPQKYYSTDAQAIAGATGLYYLVGDRWGARYGQTFGRPLIFWSALGTDLAKIMGGRTQPMQDYTYGVENPGGLRNSWQGLYRNIGDCNQFINRINNNNSDKISKSIKNRTVGEAKFLRALDYYRLTQYWGDVPMWLNELDIKKISGKIERTPVAEVRTQVVKDLTFAEENLPSSYNSSDKGRVTKWAAKMLLAHVYLYQKEWQKAKDKAGEVINNSPHHLMENYGDIFGIENEYNPEIIWSLDFKRNEHQSHYSDYFVPRSKDEPKFPGYDQYLNGFGLITSSPEFIASFDPQDKRRKYYNWPEDWPDVSPVKPANGHYVRKEMELGPRINRGLNPIIFRLADAYLMYAEAENQLNGPTSEALEKINRIRRRAFESDSKFYTASELPTKQAFHQAIMDERKWELGFEVYRRWDLVRWDHLEEAVKTQTKTNPKGVQNIQEYQKLLPIPPKEIELNSALIQNPGY